MPYEVTTIQNDSIDSCDYHYFMVVIRMMVGYHDE